MEALMPEVPHGHEAQIVVNAAVDTVPTREVSYEEVTTLAYATPPTPDTRYTVTFRNAQKPKEGSLAPGQSVEVKKEGTIFNVKATGKS
jgi:Multiubiquitin